MSKSQFANLLTNDQLHSFLKKIDFIDPVFVSKDNAPSILVSFYENCVCHSSCTGDETFHIYFKDNNRFYLMLYTDFYFTIYHILTCKDLTLDITVIPHDPQKHKLAWDHFLYTLFQKDYEVFWWSERFISRDKLIESTKARIREFDDESDKTLERIKAGKY